MRWQDRPTQAGGGSVWDSTVRFGRDVLLGAAVRIAPGAVLHDNVRVGDRTFIGPSVVLGEPLRAYYADQSYTNPRLDIGEDSVIRTGSVFYAGSTFGPGLETGPYATVREGTRAGRNCLFGNFADVQGTCRIGDYLRCHSNVTICTHAHVGNYVWMHPFVMLLNDPIPPVALELAGPSIGDYAVLAARCVVFPGVSVGRHAVVGAGTVVRESISDYALAAGAEGRVFCDARKFVGRVAGKPIRPYPWPRHRDEGYPWKRQDWQDGNTSRPARHAAVRQCADQASRWCCRA